MSVTKKHSASKPESKPETASRSAKAVRREREHPLDPALSAGLGILNNLEEKIDRLAQRVDLVAQRQEAPHPNDPALSIMLARVEGIEQRLERIFAALEPRRSSPVEPSPAPVPAVSGPDPDNAQFLSRTPLFARLSASECAILAGFLESQDLEGGDVLFSQGDFGDAMYLVRSGLLEVCKEERGSLAKVAEIRPGGLVGEMALVENKPRSAAVRAGTDAELLVLTRGAFARLKDEHPRVASKFQDELAQLLSGRLRQTTERLMEKG